MQSRSWLCTLHVQEVPMESMPVLPTQSPIEYATGQLERGADTGAIHWQFFVYFSKKKSLGGAKSALVEWLGNSAESTHLERCRGTLEQCIAYVTKSDTRIGLSFEYGTKPVLCRSGRDLLALFRSGRRLDASDPAWDGVLLRFSKSRLEELRVLCVQQSRSPSITPVCEVHIGVPGSGKSCYAFQRFPDAYPKCSGKWWDYYDGQTTVILDDFDGSFVSFGDFKRWIDRYPCLVEIKGSVVPLLAHTWIITTNVYPSHWWSKKTTGQDGRDAIWRRISRVLEHISVDVPPKEYTPEEYRSLHLFDLEPLDPKAKE